MRVSNTRSSVAGLAACLLLGMVLSVIDRTDANWDLQNYHLYAPYAALHGRLGMDWFAAGFQGYLNPTEDIPYYLAKMVLFPNHPVVVAALAGLPFGFLVFVTLNVALVVLPGRGVAVLAAILGLTGATILSEVGTTYDDILTADFVLSAVWLVLGETRWRGLALAGFLLGCAVGLKFTAATYVPGFALLCVCKHPRRLLRDAVVIMLFAAVGFVAVWGWWGWQLWVHFGNPVYPMLGWLFPANAIPGLNVHDDRFFPKTFLQWLFFPFYWLRGRSFVVYEEPLRDPRFALVYIILFARLAISWLKRDAKLSREALALIVFTVATYVCWLIVFCYLRYALALEAISGIVMFAALSGVVDRRVYLSAIGAVMIFALAFTKPVGWGRIGYGKSLIALPDLPIKPGTVVFLDGAPLGFVIPYLQQQDANFISVYYVQPGTEIFSRVRRQLATDHAAMLLTNAVSPIHEEPILTAFGVSEVGKTCEAVHSPVQFHIRLCNLSVPAN